MKVKLKYSLSQSQLYSVNVRLKHATLGYLLIELSCALLLFSVFIFSCGMVMKNIFKTTSNMRQKMKAVTSIQNQLDAKLIHLQPDPIGMNVVENCLDYGVVDKIKCEKIIKTISWKDDCGNEKSISFESIFSKF
ncbi:MAG: hypothetical protein UR26_C0005G0053 [candidate division TM6 bacterium GW2011_GWF2_32_72]|nr:MAG: hypothetical protein UR26_C0005G0053 [candidate division TM6 bacterium GW2011_GWF2_32_72]